MYAYSFRENYFKISCYHLYEKVWQAITHGQPILGVLLVAGKLIQIICTQNYRYISCSFRCYSYWILNYYNNNWTSRSNYSDFRGPEFNYRPKHNVGSLRTRYCRRASCCRPFKGTWRLHREGSGSVKQKSHHSPSDIDSYPRGMNRHKRSCETSQKLGISSVVPHVRTRQLPFMPLPIHYWTLCITRHNQVFNKS